MSPRPQLRTVARNTGNKNPNCSGDRRKKKNVANVVWFWLTALHGKGWVKGKKSFRTFRTQHCMKYFYDAFMVILWSFWILESPVPLHYNSTFENVYLTFNSTFVGGWFNLNGNIILYVLFIIIIKSRTVFRIWNIILVSQANSMKWQWTCWQCLSSLHTCSFHTRIIFGSW